MALRNGLLVVLLSSALAACGSSDGDSGAGKSGVEPLDPAGAHFGKSQSEWAVEWQKWMWQTPQTPGACVVPVEDPSGEHCAAGQDSGSDVFFLAGNFGGVTVRDGCVAPAGKALFFPVMSRSADNGGVAPADQLDDAGLEASAESVFSLVKDMAASVDGKSIEKLTDYAQGPTSFSYVVPPEPNIYSCIGMPGVVGEIKPAYVAGYWLMLPPLDPGKHDIHFEGKATTTPEDFVLDVTYHLTVQ